MDGPLTIARCFPGDFVNPYPALFWRATACAALLGLELFILFRTASGFSQALPGLWLRRARNLLVGFILSAALLTLVFVAWLGWQSLHFGSLCTAGPDGWNGPAFGIGVGGYGVGVIMALTALSIVEGLVLFARQFWLANKTAHPAR
jgi:hypothetical protein